MAITLTYGGSTLDLGDRLDWTDEYGWSPVQQATDYSVTGALLVQTATKLAGRPITLVGSETAAWISRDLCGALQGWAALPGIELDLMLRGALRRVIFNHDGQAGFAARPVWRLADGEEHAEQLYVPTLRFLQV